MDLFWMLHSCQILCTLRILITGMLLILINMGSAHTWTRSPILHLRSRSMEISALALIILKKIALAASAAKKVKAHEAHAQLAELALYFMV